jgi:hypothetical protein
MAWTEDLAPLFADFGVTVRHGARKALAIFDAPTTTALGGLVSLDDHQLTLATGDLPDLGHGDTVTIDGTAYVVREVMQLDDGALQRVTLRAA